ncbi:MAG: DMT family transporter, partial [Pseudomonadota bacterium]
GFETTDGVPLWPIGAAFFVLAGAMWGAYTVLLRLWRIPILEGTLLVAAGSSLLALPLLGPWAIADMATLPPSQLALQTVMQGLIGGVLSVVCLLGAVNALPNHVVVLLPTFTPSVALMITVLLGQKSPTPAEILGTIIITLAFIWSTQHKQKQTSQPVTNAT